ncbi:unnamed protein product [Symbiodinium natans]|uniref:Uncharacterized protein n=1 Tax=Symbiodinium natans TaxID=878477 RepID=A0A812L4H5_9DINO|nr:unnamed protein product [Symbiodinium natans]
MIACPASRMHVNPGDYNLLGPSRHILSAWLPACMAGVSEAMHSTRTTVAAGTTRRLIIEPPRGRRNARCSEGPKATLGQALNPLCTLQPPKEAQNSMLQLRRSNEGWQRAPCRKFTLP